MSCAVMHMQLRINYTFAQAQRNGIQTHMQINFAKLPSDFNDTKIAKK